MKFWVSWNKSISFIEAFGIDVRCLGMFSKSTEGFWASIRCTEKFQNFGAFSRMFDNDRWRLTILRDFVWTMRSQCIKCRQSCLSRHDYFVRRRQERLYESFRAVNIGWRFIARTKFFMKIVQKNWHNSKSLNSFGLGPIYLGSLGQDLSRNASVVSNLFPGPKIDRWKDFVVTPKKWLVEPSPLLE